MVFRNGVPSIGPPNLDLMNLEKHRKTEMIKTNELVNSEHWNTDDLVCFPTIFGNNHFHLWFFVEIGMKNFKKLMDNIRKSSGDSYQGKEYSSIWLWQLWSSKN